MGLRLGVDRYYKYFKQFGLLKKTGIDLPGEAGTIMHNPKNMGEVELATVSFGQSFQITPVQLATTVSSVINGGNRITPHFGISVESADGTQINTLEYPVETGIISEKNIRDSKRNSGESSVRRFRKKCPDRGMHSRGQDGYFPDFAKKCQPVYFFLSWFYACGRSTDPGALHYT
mgnify:CR=1 FL=1